MGAGTAALTGGLATGTASAGSSSTVHFHSTISDNFPTDLEDAAIQTMRDNVAQIDDRQDNDWSLEVIYEPIVTTDDLDGYIDQYLDDPEVNRPVGKAWWDWMEDNGTWAKKEGHVFHFLADLTSGQWADWHTSEDGDKNVSGGNIWETDDGGELGESWAYNRITPEYDPSTYASHAKQGCAHEVGHVLLGYNDGDHGIGDQYDDEDTVMYANEENCGGLEKSGTIPRLDMYGEVTIMAIDWCAQYRSSWC
ncbi:hypothetical protein BRC81_00980 [Halobacteriales archaeon QS_1_68_20]|nr:MAG: hypothetical protein BRC81_00980 [Halobacteriales archaeon QS_1_68_20]